MEKKLNNTKSSLSNPALIGIYLCVSIIGILLVVSIFNNLIKNHDNELTVDVGSLIAEKMNRSIGYMQESVDEMATVLSYQDLLELDELYVQLVDSIPESNYISIGIIAQDGSVYGLESEKAEMEKWGLVALSQKTEKVSISEPYRSSVTGKLVFTMFSPIFQQKERLGCIFVTYPLSELQELANTDVFLDQAEIYLMNSISENTILCSGSNSYLVGNWSSSRLMKKQIAPESLKIYEAWEREMENGARKSSVQFVYDGVSYTQVSEKIDAMDGWYVAVRIPNSTLSSTMQQFRSATVVFVLLLIIISLGLFYILYTRDAAEKARFEYMSTHDALTDVYNRNAFDLVVQRYLDHEGKNEQCALIFFDVDYFKQINDRFGHDVGDKTLIAFANVLKELFGKQAIIARYGGDEFVMLTKKTEMIETLSAKMIELKQKLHEVEVGGTGEDRFDLHYSAGIAVFPEHGQHFEDLVKHADVALYQVKQRGRNGFAWYEEQ